eukprot:10513308-Lingulodinium_polyedra.AAC.1
MELPQPGPARAARRGARAGPVVDCLPRGGHGQASSPRPAHQVLGPRWASRGRGWVEPWPVHELCSWAAGAAGPRSQEAARHGLCPARRSLAGPWTRGARAHWLSGRHAPAGVLPTAPTRTSAVALLRSHRALAPRLAQAAARSRQHAHHSHPQLRSQRWYGGLTRCKRR